ncbi:MAG: ABC transporter permease [Eubacteriales bacterium]|nr:ABC transporter permease [Eubacteriales bacterium]
MRFSRKNLNIPYVLFLLLFVILPLLVVCYYALTDGQGQWTLQNFRNFFTNGKTLGTLLYSVVIALVTTVVCLLVAYPTAYLLAKGPFRRGGVLLVLLVMPMWINFTLRITAVKEILNVLEGNLAYHPFFNTIFCMTYDFLPFMIMPLYTSISKLDDQLWEAAQDLGARWWQVMWKVIIPMSMPGIISGVTMVFLPAMTNYVVLDMVYNSTYIMGSLIGSYFSAYDWHNGSMISVILLLLIFVISGLSSKVAGDQTEQRGGVTL